MESRRRISPALLNRAHELRNRKHLRRLWCGERCAQARLCIEIDGASHLEPLQAEYDEARTAFLEDAGYSMVRFTNDDVRNDLDAVVEAILSKVDSILQES